MLPDQVSNEANDSYLWEWSAGKELLGHRGDDGHQHAVPLDLGSRNDLLPAGITKPAGSPPPET